MKKKIILMVVISMLMMVMVSSLSALAEDTVTLKVWSPYASAYTRPYFDKMIKIFNDSHDNIKVEHIPVSSGVQEKFRTSVIGGSAPDVVFAGMNLLYDPAGKTRSEIEEEAMKK